MNGSDSVDHNGTAGKEHDDNKPFFVMTLEFEKGKQEYIKIFPNTDPDEVSFNFCKENNLDFVSMKYLKEEISELLCKFNEKKLIGAVIGTNNSIEEVEEENYLTMKTCEQKQSELINEEEGVITVSEENVDNDKKKKRFVYSSLDSKEEEQRDDDGDNVDVKEEQGDKRNEYNTDNNSKDSNCVEGNDCSNTQINLVLNTESKNEQSNYNFKYHTNTTDDNVPDTNYNCSNIYSLSELQLQQHYQQSNIMNTSRSADSNNHINTFDQERHISFLLNEKIKEQNGVVTSNDDHAHNDSTCKQESLMGSPKSYVSYNSVHSHIRNKQNIIVDNLLDVSNNSNSSDDNSNCKEQSVQQGNNEEIEYDNESNNNEQIVAEQNSKEDIQCDTVSQSLENGNQEESNGLINVIHTAQNECGNDEHEQCCSQSKRSCALASLPRSSGSGDEMEKKKELIEKEVEKACTTEMIDTHENKEMNEDKSKIQEEHKIEMIGTHEDKEMNDNKSDEQEDDKIGEELNVSEDNVKSIVNKSEHKDSLIKENPDIQVGTDNNELLSEVPPEKIDSDECNEENNDNDNDNKNRGNEELNQVEENDDNNNHNHEEEESDDNSEDEDEEQSEEENDSDEEENDKTNNNIKIIEVDDCDGNENDNLTIVDECVDNSSNNNNETNFKLTELSVQPQPIQSNINNNNHTDNSGHTNITHNNDNSNQDTNPQQPLSANQSHHSQSKHSSLNITPLIPPTTKAVNNYNNSKSNTSHTNINQTNSHSSLTSLINKENSLPPSSHQSFTNPNNANISNHNNNNNPLPLLIASTHIQPPHLPLPKHSININLSKQRPNKKQKLFHYEIATENDICNNSNNPKHLFASRSYQFMNIITTSNHNISSPNYANTGRNTSYYKYTTQRITKDNLPRSKSVNIFEKLYVQAEINRQLPHNHCSCMYRLCNIRNMYNKSSRSPKRQQLLNVANTARNINANHIVTHLNTNPSNNKSEMNYGEYLYIKGEIAKEMKRDRVIKYKQQQMQALRKICKFKPQITEYNGINNIIKLNDIINNVKKNHCNKTTHSEGNKKKPVNAQPTSKLNNHSHYMNTTTSFKTKCSDNHPQHTKTPIPTPTPSSRCNYMNNQPNLTPFNKQSNTKSLSKSTKTQTSQVVPTTFKISNSNTSPRRYPTTQHSNIFVKLFDLIDINNNNYITYNDIIASSLPSHITSLLTPLFHSSTSPLSKSAFITKLIPIYNTLPLSQKSLLTQCLATSMQPTQPRKSLPKAQTPFQVQSGTQSYSFNNISITPFMKCYVTDTAQTQRTLKSPFHNK